MTLLNRGPHVANVGNGPDQQPGALPSPIYRPTPSTAHCHSCGIAFAPKDGSHKLCLKCWAWIRSGRLIAAAAQLRKSRG